MEQKNYQLPFMKRDESRSEFFPGFTENEEYVWYYHSGR